MIPILWESVEITLEVTLIIFFLMVAVDFLDVYFRGHIKNYIESSRFRQYVVASFLGATPGCTGVYLNVTMYMHGFMSMGALTAGMIATTGDEAFVMMAETPVKALLLFSGLFAAGLLLGALFDKLQTRLGYQGCRNCELHAIHLQDHKNDWEHYFKVHIWRHILLNHVLRIAAWTFASVFLIKLGLFYFSLGALVHDHPAMVFLFAILVGLLPISGPHLLFVSMFSGGLIPVSVLLANSIVQDGHAMLPLMSYSLKDAVIVKGYKVFAALIIGGTLYGAGF